MKFVSCILAIAMLFSIANICSFAEDAAIEPPAESFDAYFPRLNGSYGGYEVPERSSDYRLVKAVYQYFSQGEVPVITDFIYENGEFIGTVTSFGEPRKEIPLSSTSTYVMSDVEYKFSEDRLSYDVTQYGYTHTVRLNENRLTNKINTFNFFASKIKEDPNWSSGGNACSRDDDGLIVGNSFSNSEIKYRYEYKASPDGKLQALLKYDDYNGSTSSTPNRAIEFDEHGNLTFFDGAVYDGFFGNFIEYYYEPVE